MHKFKLYFKIYTVVQSTTQAFNPFFSDFYSKMVHKKKNLSPATSAEQMGISGFRVTVFAVPY